MHRVLSRGSHSVVLESNLLSVWWLNNATKKVVLNTSKVFWIVSKLSLALQTGCLTSFLLTSVKKLSNSTKTSEILLP